ncbi:unnamed protein product [Phytophthora lilii]|uniref:Unnamed protein product n=1 Tax=Phytophthora lilii TaxID=2077276 RepID=A0A9W6TXB0_9STRA|nr:unnamed protein product [Phytophthora lilii]
MGTARPPEASFGDVLDGSVDDVVDHRQNKWSTVFMPALRTFHSLYGHTEVPDNFVVPLSTPTWPTPTWGLHLGQIIRRSSDTKRLYKTQVKASQEELQKLGFTWTTTNAADRSWRHQVLPALKVFHREHGHCNVESNFVVPEWDPWPKDAWGLNLGAIVKRTRAGRSYADQAMRDSDVLAELGFLWDVRDMEWQECILPALVTFADEYGDGEPVASDFVVPSEAPWPKPTWGLELGLFLRDSLKREQYFVQIIRDTSILSNLGFEVKLSNATWERQVAPLLTIYYTIFPNEMAVSGDFEIPHKQPWPRKVWGLKLGQIVEQNPDRMVHVEKEWKQRRESPETLSLVSENRCQQWKIRILPALVTFVEVFGDCRLGGHFTVPSEEPWPKPTWGLRLGAGIADYLKNGTYFEQIGRDADRLDALGFSFKLSATPWEQYAAPLLETFSTMFPCTVVADNFVIPAEAPWHETMWGVKLGKLVKWNAQHMTDIENEWRAQVLIAVDIYQKEHEVSIEKFVVPSHSPWPSKTWGMDLACVLHRIHIGECYDGHASLARNSVARLKHLLCRRRDEAWEAIFTALKTFSKKSGHCDVKPNFVVPASAMWPKAVWNLQLGQIVEKMKTTGTFFSYVGRCATRLNKLNFTLFLSNAAWEKKVAPLIATFANLHPRDTVPYGIGWGFTIPSEEPWPENVWGVNLGVIIQWNLSRMEAIERDWKKQVLQAHEVFQYEQANKILRDKFVVPSRPPWPYKTWGRELRHILTCVQVGQHYGGHIALANFHSNDACVISHPSNGIWKTVIMPALHTFAMIFGHCAVPKDFVVPTEAPWSKQMAKLPLGAIMDDAETKGSYFAEIGLNADRLETFGFRYKLADEPWQEHVAPLLSIFANLFSHEVLPEDFVVPPKKPWPQKLWGLRLGKIVTWSSRFVWNLREAQWKKSSVRTKNTDLASEFGYCEVPASFKVPNKRPWPKHMLGLQIKVYLRQIQQRGDLYIPGGLHRAMMDEKKFGFVFKLATKVLREPERNECKEEVEQVVKSVDKTQQEDADSSLGKRPLPDIFCKRQEGWIGSYSPKSRKARVQRFHKKRQERVWLKEIKYDVRKSFADTRLRVKGRFVTRHDEITLRNLLSFT